jgi:hypothetical protein
LESKDLVQNNNGEINQKNKGSKKSLCLGAYEFGDGYFDLKFDGKIGIRTVAPNKDRRNRTPSSNIVKANHFWWLISKAFLNKYLLEDARDSLKEFIGQTQQEGDNKEKDKHVKIEGLFNKDWIDFDTLVKNDPDLEGIKPEDLKDRKCFQKNPLLDDSLWLDNFEEDAEDSHLTVEQGINFYKAKLDNASEDDLKNLINIIDDHFQIESSESKIGTLSSNFIAKKAALRLGTTIEELSIEYSESWVQENWFLHNKQAFKQTIESLREEKLREFKWRVNSLIELHMHNFIDDKTFYSDFKSCMDHLGVLNKELTLIDDEVIDEKEEDKETEIDRVIKNLQCQLVGVKAENILGFKRLVQETNSPIIEQQTEQLEKRNVYITECIKPLKEMHMKLYEECAALE